MKNAKVAVIGCGIFGAMAAIRLAESGIKVCIFDLHDKPLNGASLNNQNRLHLGFHYPRDDETAIQCVKGFDSFRKEFSECILDNFNNAYFIASEGSLTSADEYLKFCDRLNLEYEIIDPELYSPQVRNVDLGILCYEVVYDSKILRQIITDKFKKLKIQPRFNSEVTNISKNQDDYLLEVNGNDNQSFNAVVNCTYADLNRLNFQMGHSIKELQYEYTLVPVVDWFRPPVGVTIMDGPFMTVLPFGKSGKFLLYHVGHTVIDREISMQMPIKWREKNTAPTKDKDKKFIYEKIVEGMEEFIPSVLESKLEGFLETTRVVLANKDDTDGRPSIIQEIEKGFLSVFTGKIDHCTWVSEEISHKVNGYLGY